MDNLTIEKTKSTPAVFFDAGAGVLQMEGESYPENVVKFYAPLLDWLREYLSGEPEEVIMEFKISYFNSSTSKVFMTMFDLLEQYVEEGKKARVRWICDEENDVAIECGEEFKEDLESLSFEIEVC